MSLVRYNPEVDRTDSYEISGVSNLTWIRTELVLTYLLTYSLFILLFLLFSETSIKILLLT